MDAGMIDCISLLLVRDAQEKVGTVQRGNITENRVSEWPNSKGNSTAPGNHETRTILKNPTQLIRRRASLLFQYRNYYRTELFVSMLTITAYVMILVSLSIM